MTALTCPQCGGAVFDNRGAKTNPKQPDLKCKDKACGWVQWPPREPRAPAPPAPYDPEPPAPQYASPPPRPPVSPSITRSAVAAALPAPVATRVNARMAELRDTYRECLLFAIEELNRQGIDDPQAIVAATATLFIQAQKA